MDEAAQCATLDRIWVPPAGRPPLGRRSIVTGTAYFLLFGANAVRKRDKRCLRRCVKRQSVKRPRDPFSSVSKSFAW
jgi:hypothetical protein